MLPLSKQICSYSLAKKLKNLGVNQDSYFIYYGTVPEAGVPSDYIKMCNRDQWASDVVKPRYSAFTASELGEILPDSVYNGIDSFQLTIEKWDIYGLRRWNCKYFYEYTVAEFKEFHETSENTLPDALASMLIYLLENNIITL